MLPVSRLTCTMSGKFLAAVTRWRPRELPKLARRIGRGGIPIAGFVAAKIAPESHKGLALQFRHFHLYWVSLETVIGSNTND